MYIMFMKYKLEINDYLFLEYKYKDLGYNNKKIFYRLCEIEKCLDKK